MKKGCLTAALAVMLALLTLLAAAPAVNDRAAKKVAKDLEALPLPADTMRLETVYRAGKLVGCGNGMQYFGGMLLESGLPLEELRDWHQKSGLPLKKFFNTSGMEYRALGLKDKLSSLSEEEQLALLASSGMLVKRPLLIGEDFVLAGFKESQWEEVLC